MEGKLLLGPTSNLFESKGVLNPAAVRVGEEVYLYYRAVADNLVSSIGFCRLKNNEIIERWNKPILEPEFDYEIMGMEDPRITLLDGVYYMIYTAYDGLDARVAYAISTDLFHWEKKGLISPSISYDEAEDIFRTSGELDLRYKFYERTYRGINGDQIMLWEKDVVLFPKRFDGLMMFFHRILPGIQVCYVDSFERLNEEYWRDYLKHLEEYVVMDPKSFFESAYIGAGCPPLETERGWLFIYHAVVVDSVRGKIYRAGAALLDKDDPTKVLARLPTPLFEPEADYERNGNVDNVVFPTGIIEENGVVYIYYGCADRNIGVKWVSITDLLDRFL